MLLEGPGQRSHDARGVEPGLHGSKPGRPETSWFLSNLASSIYIPYIQKIEKPVEFFEAELESGIFTHYL
jgi:hypothetical protein